MIKKICGFSKKKSFRNILAILLFTSMILFSSGCSCGKPKDTGLAADLKYWRVNEDEEIFKPIFALFNESYPNIKVDYTKKDLSEYYDQLMDSLAAGTGPDVFSIRNDWLPAFKDKIDTMPEDIYTKDQFKETFVGVAANDLTDNNGIYGIPLSVDSLSLIYNNRMLDDARCTVPPKNWNDFIACSKKITKINGNRIKKAGTALGTANNLAPSEEYSKRLATDIISAMTLQSGGEMVSSDRLSASFGLPVQKQSGGNVYPGTSALNFFTSFARPTKETYSWHSKMRNAVKSFANEETAMIFGYSDMVKEIENQNPGLTLFSAPIPQIKGSDTPKTIASYWVEVVSKQTKNRAASWKLLKYLTQSDGMSKYMAATSRPPSRKDLVEGASATTRYGAFAGQLDYAVTWYKGKEPEKVYDIFSRMINGVLSGQKLQNAIDSARNAVTALLQSQK